MRRRNWFFFIRRNKQGSKQWMHPTASWRCMYPTTVRCTRYFAQPTGNRRRERTLFRRNCNMLYLPDRGTAKAQLRQSQPDTTRLRTVRQSDLPRGVEWRVPPGGSLCSLPAARRVLFLARIARMLHTRGCYGQAAHSGPLLQNNLQYRHDIHRLPPAGQDPDSPVSIVAAPAVQGVASGTMSDLLRARSSVSAARRGPVRGGLGRATEPRAGVGGVWGHRE
ncbi:hypothetical protein F4780DRAFT_141376 [Xylariomycetidae sp. FL0641]|nr:hypothetical protein F4780DRAFT_141376 [Xylariomycetidae sp. FL0641]